MAKDRPEVQSSNCAGEKLLSELDLHGEISIDQMLFAGKSGCGSCG